jgi:pimeloyl-ACP methyl ester carboxylesterase
VLHFEFVSPTHRDFLAWRRAGSFFSFRGTGRGSDGSGVHRVFYRRAGRGTPLLLVHGYPTSSWDWARIWDPLAERFDVIAADMLGFGESDKPRGHRYTIGEQADLQLALLDDLGIPECHALVHDYGVTVGQELLARVREGVSVRLHSIAFLNGGLFPETHRARPSQRLLASPLGPCLARLSTRRTFARSFRAVFGPQTQPTDEDLHGFWQLASQHDGMLALAGLIAYMRERRERRERWVAALVDAKLPMLVINGVLDPVSGAHMLERLEQLRPGTEIVRLPVGHYPQVEAPGAVLEAYLRFVGPIDAKLRSARS